MGEEAREFRSKGMMDPQEGFPELQWGAPGGLCKGSLAFPGRCLRAHNCPKPYSHSKAELDRALENFGSRGGNCGLFLYTAGSHSSLPSSSSKKYRAREHDGPLSKAYYKPMSLT